MFDRTYLAERIAKTKEALEAWEDAEIAIAAGAQSYTIDTGQSTQRVTQYSIGEITRTIDRLCNRLATLEARLYGCGVTKGNPAW